MIGVSKAHKITEFLSEKMSTNPKDIPFFARSYAYINFEEKAG